MQGAQEASVKQHFDYFVLRLAQSHEIYIDTHTHTQEHTHTQLNAFVLVMLVVVVVSHNQHFY